MSSNDTPDWLDDALRPRPVDDDGFGARVVAVGVARRRNRLFVRSAAVLALAGVLGVYLAVGYAGEREFVLGPAIDGASWIAANRDRYARAVDAFDDRPGLRRRSGRDASVVLDAASRDWWRCGWRACDTSFFVGLAGFDQWQAPANVSTSSIDDAAEQHLRAALAQPGPDGVAAFAVAAADVEALGRLVLGFSSDGALVFATVARLKNEAELAGRELDFEPTLTITEARAVQSLWLLGAAFVSPAAQDDDVEYVLGLRSVLGCGGGGAAASANLYEFLNDDARRRQDDVARRGCVATAPSETDYQRCIGEPPVCEFSLLVARLPPFRSRLTSRAYDLDESVVDLMAATHGIRDEH